VRPDGYVAWAGPGSAGLTAALESWFGPARVTAGV
jgi:oxygenase